MQIDSATPCKLKPDRQYYNALILTLPKAFLNYPHVLFGSIEITIHKSFYQQTDQHTSKVSRTTTKDFFQKLALINTNGLSKDGLLASHYPPGAANNLVIITKPNPFCYNNNKTINQISLQQEISQLSQHKIWVAVYKI